MIKIKIDTHASVINALTMLSAESGVSSAGNNSAAPGNSSAAFHDRPRGRRYG